MRPDKPLGPPRVCCELGNGDRGGVRGQDRVVLELLVQGAKHLRLYPDGFRDSFYRQVRVWGVLCPRLDMPEDLVHLVLQDALLLHGPGQVLLYGLKALLYGFLVHVRKTHREPGLCGDLGYAASHLTRPYYLYLFNGQDLPPFIRCE